MVSFNRFIGWCLVGLIGLISFDASAASVSTTKPGANVACLDSAAASISSGATDAKCVFKDVTPRVSPPLYGGYVCVQIRKTANSASVGYCSNSSSTQFCLASSSGTIQTCQNAYDNFVPSQTTAVQINALGPTQGFVWTTPEVNCNLPEFTSRTLHAPTPSGTGSVCHNGCVASVSLGYFGGKYPNGYLEFAFNYNGNECAGEPQPISDPLIQDADGDGKDDGTDPCPNDPSDTCNIPDDSKDTDGDGVPDHKDPYPNDPNDGKDDGDGDESDNTASGGGTCVTPPSCGGDAIQCNQLFQLWSIRCGKGEGTAQEPGSGTDGNGGEGTDVKGIEDRLDQLHEDNENIFADPDAVISTDGIHQSVEYTTDDLDGSGMGFPRSCNFQPISVPVGAGSVQIDFGSSGACEIFNWTGLLVVGLASFLGCFILIRV